MFFFLSEPDSPLKKFLEQTSKMTPEERATFLEKDEVGKVSLLRTGWQSFQHVWRTVLRIVFSCFLFQSIRVTHESSAQEGQTEVSFWFLTLCVVSRFFACFVLNLMHFNVCFLSVVGPKFRRESESAFYSFCECWRALIWTGWVSHKAKMCL